MLMNYHEMTMNEPANSPAKKRQYLVICTVMAAAFAWSVLQAGGLAPVTIEEGHFFGGKFVYKYTKRDYAAAGSLLENIAKDANLKPANETVDRLFSVYLDDPNIMGGRRQRFACGLLDTGKDNGKSLSSDPSLTISDRQAILLAKNKGRVPPTKLELEEDGAFKLWPKLEYKQTTLPSSKALVVQFPFTDGFVSALLLGWRILPTLRQAALDAGAEAPVVLSTCSAKESMCTHYAPLKSVPAFLLGQADTTTYLASLPPESSIDLTSGYNKLTRRAASWFGGWFGLFQPDPSDQERKEEL